MSIEFDKVLAIITSSPDPAAALEAFVAQEREVAAWNADPTDRPRLQLFGPKWDDTPIGAVVPWRVEVPLDKTCFRCGGEFTPEQSGVWSWHISQTDTPVYEPWHRLCFLLVNLPIGVAP